MNNKKIIENLLKLSNFNYNDFEEFKEKEWVYEFFGKNHIYFDEERLNLFREASDAVFKDDLYMKDNFPVEYIDDKLKDIISEAISQPENEREPFIKREIKKFKDNIKNQISDLIFRFPVENLKVKENIKIGNIKLFTFDDIEFEKVKENFIKYRVKQLEKAWSKEQIEELKDDINQNNWFELEFFKDNLNKTFAEINIKGIGYNSKTLDYAKIKAIKGINLALNCLKLFISQDYSFGLKGESLIGIYRGYYLNNQDKPILQNSEIIGHSLMFDLNDDIIKSLKNRGFDKLNKILLKQKKTKYESNILNSIYWFGEASNVHVHNINSRKEAKKDKIENLECFRLGERVIKLFIALESILIFDKNEPIVENISERVAFILGKDYETRVNIKKRIKDLYVIRSNITHKGDVYVSKYDMIDLLFIVQNVLIKLISNKKFNFKETADLKNYFDELKYS
ncbi:hypothetical protein KQY27_05210 [Methanobrevibacter sp. TMH8]|uniref:HEPN domain-containing protein n=1 Tax=Methanobrevibacter sp. TMH8 TaxID=2848611 RepID=UPI001CC910F3|nr:HEPN domain-containing protein [Methanobrevibacter sp. TMH8]MBZ9570939.1 hypothetical protein [Methanobrevibacter sp. TMH8]